MNPGSWNGLVEGCRGAGLPGLGSLAVRLTPVSAACAEVQLVM